MALARSASVPGGLSINTGSANSLFGSSSAAQPAASGGLFGGAAKPQTGGGGLFGATSAPQTQGMFGKTQPSGGGLFGSSTAAPQAQQTGSLFGSAAASTSQPAQAGGLFGSAAGQPSQPSQFGSAFTAPALQSQAASTGGNSGLNLGAQQQNQSGGLFGGLNQNKPATSLFGSLNNTAQQQQTQPNSLFSSGNKPVGQSGFGNFGGSTATGGLTMGQSQNQAAQQTVPGVRIDISQVRTTSRFNDLHEGLQKEIETLDKFILAQIQLYDDCSAIMPSHGDQLSLIPNDVDLISRKLAGVKSSASDDAEAIEMVRKSVYEDVGSAKLSFKAIDNLKLPAQYHHQGIWNGTKPSNPEGAQDLVSFFSNTADDMGQTLGKYQGLIGEIETHLRGVEASSFQQVAQISGGDQQEQMRELSLVLREFEQGIVGVAGSVGATREALQSLQLGSFLETGTAEARKNGNGKRSGVY